MSRRDLLTTAERQVLFGLPGTRDGLARVFLLDTADMDRIQTRRGAGNRLGFAVQLMLLRHPGLPLVHVLDLPWIDLAPLVGFLAEQIGVPPDGFAAYRQNPDILARHGLTAAQNLGLRPPTRADLPFLVEAAATAAWATDKGAVIAAAAVCALKQARVVLPPPATIERAAITGRALARKRSHAALLEGLSADRLAALDALSAVNPETGLTRLTELRTAHLRNKLRSGDVWVERSQAYRRFDSYLLPPARAAPVVQALDLPADADTWLDGRALELDRRLKRFATRLGRGQLEGVELRDGRLAISPVRATPRPEADALADRIAALLPRVRITELLHEVARDTGFLSAFTNLRTGEACANENALLAVILADATNLGLARMAEASQGLTRDQLFWTADAFIRAETYTAALARTIDAHKALPIAAAWGDGTTSSSDGQFFRSAKRGAGAGDVNARYGVDPGLAFYTHVSDQHGPYHVTVISATAHEAPYVLDGLLHHGSGLSILEHYTDTGGATDSVFALTRLLGFRFCPRLRDFPDRRLAAIAPASTYPTLEPLLGRRVRTDVIREHWEDILRLVASLKAGHALPSAMLRKLSAYERQNRLDLALQELGKVERTLFMLDWLESPALRRRCQAGLNKGEERHALAQAVCTFRQGRIADRTHEAQQYRASGLNLVIAAIVWWNSTYMQEAVAHLKSRGDPVPGDLLAHTSPVTWEHIGFSGDFLWDQAATVAATPRQLAISRQNRTVA